MFLSNREKSRLRKEIVISLGKLVFDEVIKEGYEGFENDRDLFEQIGMVFLEGRGGNNFFAYRKEDKPVFKFTKDIFKNYKLFRED